MYIYIAALLFCSRYSAASAQVDDVALSFLAVVFHLLGAERARAAVAWAAHTSTAAVVAAEATVPESAAA